MKQRALYLKLVGKRTSKSNKECGNNFTECKCQCNINSSYFYSSGEIFPLHSGFIPVHCPSKHLITSAPLNTGNTANRENQKDKTVEYN